MSANIAALTFAWLAHSLAFLITPKAIPFNERLNAFIVWTTAAAALFLLQDTAFVFFAVACILICLAPAAAAPRAAFFLVAALVLPTTMQADIPFPGINYLTTLTPYKLVSALVLIPILLKLTPTHAPITRLATPDLCVILYVIFTTLHATITGNVTIGLRQLLDQFLIFALPYFALRRALSTVEDIDIFIRAILISAINLAAIALVATWKQWDFYGLLGVASVSSLPDMRSGFVRVGATTNTTSLGLIAGFGLASIEYLKHNMRIGRLNAIIARLALVGGIYFTDSRGAMMATVLIFVVYTLVNTERAVVRWGYAVAALSGLIATAVWLFLGDFSENKAISNSDTFGFRQEMISTSVRHILNYPVFGDHLFFTKPEFQSMRNQQGIIDIVCVYIQVALSFGLVGLAMFLGIFLFPLLYALGFFFQVPGNKGLVVGPQGPVRLSRSDVDLSGVRSSAPPDRIVPFSKNWTRIYGVVLGLLAGWLLMISTTSDTGSILHIGVFSVALLMAFLRITEAETADAAEKNDRGMGAVPLAP
jgi:hypothetical protein